MSNPNKFKNQPKKITKQRIYNRAVYYLERYPASSGKLRFVIRRRLKKDELRGSEIPDETDQWIDEIIQKMIEIGYLDDGRFIQNRVRILREKGKSQRSIALSLTKDGISAADIRAALQEDDLSPDEREMDSAFRFARKKKFGPFRQGKEGTPDVVRREMASFARAGFSYDTAQKVLKSSTCELNEN